MYSVIFMGSPDFAVKSLEALIESDLYDVKLVVSQTDKPQGRKQILTAPPVKLLALQCGIEVYQPNTLKTDEAFQKLYDIHPDFIVVAAYGKILPQRVLDIPKYGCVNLHGSLLPKYRGAAPIQWSVINGERITGVTSMLMNAGLDTGDILLTSETEIGPNETAGELFDRLASLCPDLLLLTLEKLVSGEIAPKKQDDSQATYVGTLNKDLAVINWNDTADLIHNKVRGLNPWPVAKTLYNGKIFKIFMGRPHNAGKRYLSGSIYSENGRLYVDCGEHSRYEITELQLEGAKRMSSADFLRGHSMVSPFRLG